MGKFSNPQKTQQYPTLKVEQFILSPYSLNRLLWIFIRTSLPMVPAMGLLTSELWGLTPGDRGLMLMGEV